MLRKRWVFIARQRKKVARLPNSTLVSRTAKAEVSEKIRVVRRHGFLRAAKQGHVRSQYTVAQDYDAGVGVKRNNVEAAKWYWQAAQRGSDRAQYQLGQIFRTGRAGKVNQGETIRWYWRRQPRAIRLPITVSVVPTNLEPVSQRIRSRRSNGSFWPSGPARRSSGKRQPNVAMP